MHPGGRALLREERCQLQAAETATVGAVVISAPVQGEIGQHHAVRNVRGSARNNKFGNMRRPDRGVSKSFEHTSLRETSHFLV